MLNNSNNFSVEAIVAKYVNAVKAQWESTPEYKDWCSPIPTVDLSSGTDFAFAPHQQLLATVWSIVNGNPTEGQLVGELAHYIGFFNRDILTEEEIEYLVANYKECVNYIFSQSEDWMWREISFFEQPEGICDLMTKLLDYKSGDTLYIPFVEYGDLAVRFPDCKIKGRVSSRRVWAFCCIRLQANGISYDIPYDECEDAQEIILPEAGTADCIICDASELVFDVNNAIKGLYTSLKSSGRMTVIVPPHVLGGMGDSELAFRKKLINDKSLEAIVQLPSDIFRASNESFFVLCIDKRQKDAEYEGVVMADATFATRDYGVKSTLKRLDVERFVEAVQHSDSPEAVSICKRIPFDKVDADLLLPAHYLVEKPSFAMGLHNVLRMAKLDSTTTTGVMPAVIAKDLTSSFENANLSVSELSSLCDCGKKEEFAVVTEPCVFLCSTGDTILVGYVSEVPETGIAVSKRVNCFTTVNADVASATLLLLEDYVGKQIKALSVGKLMRKFDNNLLAKIKVYPLVYDEELDWELELEAIKAEQEKEEMLTRLELEAMQEDADRQALADEIAFEAMQEDADRQALADEIAFEAMQEDAERQALADEIAFEAMQEDAERQKIALSIEVEELKRASLQQRDRMQKKLYDTIEHQKQEGVNQYEEFRKSVRLRKHALTQSLSSFGSMFNALMNCRRRQSGFLDDTDKLSDISDLTVSDAFAYLESRLESIQQKLAAIADVEEDLGKPENIEPIEFINSYIGMNQAGWLRFKALTGWENFITNRATRDIPSPDGSGFILRKGDPLNTLYFPKKALSRIFDNIIANAVAHGFTDSTRSDYKVRFSWEANGMEMTLVIENNGKAIPTEVNTADILEYGFSTSLNSGGHNGIGCSEIATIMRDFDGIVKVISTPQDEYTVKYMLTFKRTNTILSL